MLAETDLLNVVFKISDDLSVTKDYSEFLIQKEAYNFLIVCVYRPPGTNVASFNSEFSVVLNMISSKSDRLCFILGHLNLDLLKCDMHIPTGELLNTLFTIVLDDDTFPYRNY